MGMILTWLSLSLKGIAFFSDLRNYKKKGLKVLPGFLMVQVFKIGPAKFVVDLFLREICSRKR